MARDMMINGTGASGGACSGPLSLHYAFRNRTYATTLPSTLFVHWNTSGDIM